MSLFAIFAILIPLAALFGFVNERTLRLPTAIGVTLGARFAAVWSTIELVQMRSRYPPYTVRVMAWGGLRGGLSIALALSLPETGERELILGMTYVVVVFSILVQGLTIGRLARKMPADAT